MNKEKLGVILPTRHIINAYYRDTCGMVDIPNHEVASTLHWLIETINQYVIFNPNCGWISLENEFLTTLKVEGVMDWETNTDVFDPILSRALTALFRGILAVFIYYRKVWKGYSNVDFVNEIDGDIIIMLG